MFVIESAEPLAAFVWIGVQVFKLVETHKITVSPAKRPDKVVINLPPAAEGPPKSGAVITLKLAVTFR